VAKKRGISIHESIGGGSSISSAWRNQPQAKSSMAASWHQWRRSINIGVAKKKRNVVA